ncbi:MAG: ABC transporter ATP-binding protein [Flaviflexus sp.]|nr:ABC transporter ATP-binding protein [Flaviflexus sp.]
MISLSLSHTIPGGPTILRDIELELDEPRIGIIGGNGSGKSTLLRIIAGLVKPSSGRALLDDAEVTKLPAGRIGMCFAEPDTQIVMPTVAADVGFSLRHLPKAERAAEVGRMLEALGIADLAERACHVLSGGQKQLLALAAVLATSPSVLLLDEPSTLLDLRNRKLLEQILDRLDQQIILATHSLDMLAGFDRVIVLEEGKVAADGEPATAIPTYEAMAWPG